MKTVIVLLALSLSSLAQANPHLTVRFADLDLNRPHDVEVLYHRITVAAENVCPYIDERSLKYQEIRKACVRQTVDSAVYYTGSLALAEYARTR